MIILLFTNIIVQQAEVYGECYQMHCSPIKSGVHKSFHPTIQDGSMWSKFGARGEHGDVLRFTTEVFSGSPTCKLTVVDV